MHAKDMKGKPSDIPILLAASQACHYKPTYPCNFGVCFRTIIEHPEHLHAMRHRIVQIPKKKETKTTGPAASKREVLESRSNDKSGIEVLSIDTPIKSNLKKSTLMVEKINGVMSSSGRRKVSWPDAHGKDIAHVQEFEPSEDGELGDAGNSCRCAIQ